MRRYKLKLVLSVILLFSSPLALAYSHPIARVKAAIYKLPDGRIEYSYSVTNKSKSNIAMVWVGHVFRREEPELSVMPVGWDFFKGMPKDSCISPEGWECLVVTQEESSRHFLEWSIKERGAVPFKPGKVLKGFKVILPRADDTYLKGHFTVFFDGDEPFSSRLSY